MTKANKAKVWGLYIETIAPALSEDFEYKNAREAQEVIDELQRLISTEDANDGRAG